MAITILSSFEVSALINAIAVGDCELISKAKGVGKKTAERIVLELKNKILSFNLINNTNITNNLDNSLLSNYNEAINALVAMGLTKLDASELVKNVAKSEDSTEKIISAALKNLSK